MKSKQTIFPILFAATLIFFASCNSNQSPDQSLKDDSQRTKIISTIVEDPAYSKEIIGVMMQDDKCKNMMMDNMMIMCESDTSMCNMMIGKTMDMCDMDQSKCNMMMGCMQAHPNVMKSMKGMCDMKDMKECCLMKEGKMMHCKDGKTMPMEKDMTMANGTKCMTNGACVMKNGEKMMMKNGDCMDMSGKMDKCDMMHKTAETDKKKAANYACPMHPEVTSDKPGKCSKCGMDLEKKK